jgi:transposase InsO family protein
MGWTETRAVDERMRFMLAAEAGEEPFAVVCRRFGVSRKTGYKWLERYEAEGVAGLADRPRAPHTHPQALDEPIAERCLAVRREHPSWGPVKVRAFLEGQSPSFAWPAASTIGALFDREGLTVKRRMRRRSPPSSAPFAACRAANDAWCIDFKGWFVTGDGRRCEPLTLIDAHSRYLLRCQALARSDGAHVWPVLAAALREFGLPRVLRSDNGAPFASCGAGGLSNLSVKLVKAGVVPERIEPGKPQQNGRQERMHLTLLQDAASPPAATRRAQMARLDAFRRVYNEKRPHAALGNATPAARYAPSPRRWDGVLRAPHYDRDETVKRVRPNGAIRWRGVEIYVNAALDGEPIGLAEQADGAWRVRYGPVALGVIDHRGERLRKPPRAACGLVDDAARRPQGPQEQQPQTALNETGNVSPMSPV